MRFSGFIVGGILGAAVALYYTSGAKKPMLLSGLNSDSMNKMFGNAKSKLNTIGSFAGSNAANHTNTTPSASKSPADSSSSPDLKQVQQIVNEDPALKSKVNDIMEESGHQYKQ